MTTMSDGEQPQSPETDGDVEVASPSGLEFTFPELTVPKISIVGFATGSAHKAPFADEQVETWGINQLWKQLPDRRWTRWFELHSLYDFYHANPGHQDFLRQLAGKDVPVYVREQDYALALEWGITSAQPFPHRVLLEQFRPYFTNTISWLVALAILMRQSDGSHASELSLYGVDMAQDHLLAAEYSEQRPSCEYFLGIAEATLASLVIPNGCDLLAATHLYGYDDSGRTLEKMSSRFVELGANKEQVTQQVAQLKAQVAQGEGTLAALQGAQQEITYWRKNWLTLPAQEDT
jgi:hypothetical protein